jgi:tetratricopeptide (TPR) repeat protein
MQDVVGTRPSKWCAGCHDHAVIFAGKFDRPIKEQIDTPEAQVGLACTSCHSIVHVKSTMGQGDFTIEYPPLHDLAASDNKLLQVSHDYLLKLDPNPHARTFLKSFHTEQVPQFCASCHKVHLDVPVNAYRWLRGFNEYDNWQASGVSGEGARSFYYPAKPQNCADCHMPLVPSNDPAARGGKVHSHRFPGANTALPFVNGDQEQLELTQAFLKSGAVTIDVFGLVPGGETVVQAKRVTGGEPRLSSSFAQGEESMAFGAQQAVLRDGGEVMAPLDKVQAAIRRGDSGRLEVVVRTRKVGHFFPGGTVDAFDVWVELEVTDSNGRKVFHSGFTEPDPNGPDRRGPVEPGAHFYRSLMLDAHGNRIDKRNAWATRSVAYVRLIPPGAADTVHYRLRVPPDAGDRLLVTARLNYRKFAWWNTQWAFAGVRDPQHTGFSLSPHHDDGRWLFTGDTSKVSGNMKMIPDLPVTVMAEAKAEIRVLPADAPAPVPEPFLDASVRERWNDYGIGLLLQGDLKAAEAAFLKVTRMEPGYADGWVNVGRARLTEGNLEGAEEALRKALEVDPKLAKTHFFLGTVLKQSGRYDEGLRHLREAAALYPRDRVVRGQIGRLLFLERQYREAIGELQQVLAIDPEDLQAHYNLMLSYQGVGDSEMARKHEALYRRFKADESAQTITGPYRQLHPHDNNERQAVHEHESGLGGGRYAAPAPERAQADRQGRGRIDAAATRGGAGTPRRPVGSGSASALAGGSR